jgi:hypothetical protein
MGIVFIHILITFVCAMINASAKKFPVMALVMKDSPFVMKLVRVLMNMFGHVKMFAFHLINLVIINAAHIYKNVETNVFQSKLLAWGIVIFKNVTVLIIVYFQLRSVMDTLTVQIEAMRHFAQKMKWNLISPFLKFVYFLRKKVFLVLHKNAFQMHYGVQSILSHLRN